MCLAEASVRKRNALAAGADQRRAEPKVSLPPPISGLMPAKPGQDVVGANARDHVGLAFGVAGAIDRGPDGQCQVLDVTDRVKGPRRVGAGGSLAAMSTAVDIEVPIGVIAQAAVRGVRTRAPLSV
jgi:hypothetical protein